MGCLLVGQKCSRSNRSGDEFCEVEKERGEIVQNGMGGVLSITGFLKIGFISIGLV